MNFLLKIVLKSVKSAKSASKTEAWLKTKSKQMEILKRRDQQGLSGDSIFQMQRPFHGRQATSVSSVNSMAIYDKCRGFSTNPPFFAKQTQYFPVFGPKTTICKYESQFKANFNPIFIKSKPIQSQTNPIYLSRCLLSGYRLGNLGNLQRSFVSSIKDPASSIENPASKIQSPASRFKYYLLFADFLLKIGKFTISQDICR
jgi:hypothetical protein